MSKKNTKHRQSKKGAIKIEQEPTNAQWREQLAVLLKQERFRKSVSVGMPLLLLAVAVVMVVYYLFGPAKTEFHSDCTDTIFWAKATYDSGKLISEDFNYACLLPFGGNLLMLLFMPFFGLSMTTHTLGMLLFFLLLTAALCWMLWEMGWKCGGICCSAAAFLAVVSSSAKLREIFWGHIIYYSLGILFLFVGLALLFRLQNLHMSAATASASENARKIRIHTNVTFVVLLLFFLLCATDKITAITIFALPMLAGIFLERLLDRKTPLLQYENRQSLALILFLGVALYFGMQLGTLLAGGVTAGYADSYSSFADQSAWVENAQKFPLAWMTLLGLENIPDESLMSGTSIVNLIRMITAILLLVIPILASCCYPKYEGKDGGKMRILIWAHWAVTGLIMIGYICGKLSAANWRLSPIVCTSTVVSLAFLHWAISKQTVMQRVAGVFCIPIVCFCVISAWNVKGLDNDYQNSTLYEISAALEDEDLSYGYATF